MILTGLSVSAVETNCYIIGCERTKIGAIIDPGDEADRIMARVIESGIIPKYIINTHGHIDHVGANREVKERTGAQILIHPEDADRLVRPQIQFPFLFGHLSSSPPADGFLEEGDIVELGEIKLRVLHTPGHSPGSISLVTDKIVFTGDALFAGSIGRTDFPGGSYDTLINSIKTKLLTLDDDMQVLPGHGPVTTIGWERKRNPFLVD